jgi:hypothetical protein
MVAGNGRGGICDLSYDRSFMNFLADENLETRVIDDYVISQSE